MNRGTAVLMAIIMIATPLAGCAGEDAQPHIDRVAELEASAAENKTAMEADQATIAANEVQIAANEAQIAALEALIAAGEGDNTVLQNQNAHLISQVADLKVNVSEAYTEGYGEGYDDGYENGASSGGSGVQSTLDVIIARGSMKCGVKESQYGMGYLDSATGVRSGLDISYCRALAAAIGLNPDTDVEYIPASGSDRFEKLAAGTIDVLIRTTTWTTSRDADLNADFAGMNFFDGQGILIREDVYPAADAGNSAAGLNGANICVGIGTTTEGNMVDWFTSRDISFTSVPVADAAEATAKFTSGECDAFTGDMSAMVAKKWQLDNDGDVGSDIWIASELMSKEPLGAAVRDYDTDWKDVVAWVWYGMVTAEEMGVTSSNYAAMASAACDGSDPGMCRLLTENLGLGTNDNPLLNTWMQDVLSAVGNYGEAYDDAFCDGTYDGTSGSAAMSGCLIARSGTLNALVSEGGIQYAPPMR